MKTKTMIERFHDSYMPVTETGCWLWIGCKSSCGYPQIHTGQNKYRAAHRYSFELFKGPIPAGMCVCHKCDTPSCVNPDHFFIGTHAENMADQMRKGRHKTRSINGPPVAFFLEKNPNAKLKNVDVLEIRRIARFTNKRVIAERFGVHPMTITRILNGSTWSSLEI
jgi:hypothetical protein